ncbi:MAG: hypothetical protein ACYC6Y_21020 [Thermoguttaceae bacterium]
MDQEKIIKGDLYIVGRLLDAIASGSCPNLVPYENALIEARTALVSTQDETALRCLFDDHPEVLLEYAGLLFGETRRVINEALQIAKETLPSSPGPKSESTLGEEEPLRRAVRKFLQDDVSALMRDEKQLIREARTLLSKGFTDSSDSCPPPVSDT